MSLQHIWIILLLIWREVKRYHLRTPSLSSFSLVRPSNATKCLTQPYLVRQQGRTSRFYCLSQSSASLLFLCPPQSQCLLSKASQGWFGVCLGFLHLRPKISQTSHRLKKINKNKQVTICLTFMTPKSAASNSFTVLNSRGHRQSRLHKFAWNVWQWPWSKYSIIPE